VRDGCIWGVDMLQESNWTATKGHYVHTVPGRDTPYTVRHASAVSVSRYVLLPSYFDGFDDLSLTKAIRKPSTFGSGANPGAAFPLSRNS